MRLPIILAYILLLWFNIQSMIPMLFELVGKFAAKRLIIRVVVAEWGW